ncbi:MAG: hypothetical protein ACFFBP_11690 [Promethearchaeota archaeon]
MGNRKMSSIGSDKDKAARYIIGGLIIAVIFGTVVGISKAIALNATAWGAYQNNLNTENLDQGVYGQTEYDARAREIATMTLWMAQQDLYIATIAMFGVNLGLVLLTVGFVGFAINDSLDERTRRASLVLAAVVIFALMFTSLFSGITIFVS